MRTSYLPLLLKILSYENMVTFKCFLIRNVLKGYLYIIFLFFQWCIFILFTRMLSPEHTSSWSTNIQKLINLLFFISYTQSALFRLNHLGLSYTKLLAGDKIGHRSLKPDYLMVTYLAVKGACQKVIIKICLNYAEVNLFYLVCLIDLTCFVYYAHTQSKELSLWLNIVTLNMYEYCYTNT